MLYIPWNHVIKLYNILLCLRDVLSSFLFTFAKMNILSLCENLNAGQETLLVFISECCVIPMYAPNFLKKMGKTPKSLSKSSKS